MKRFLPILLAVLLSNQVASQAISIDEAREATLFFMACNEQRSQIDSMPHRATLRTDEGLSVAYVFDLSNYGFVIAGALADFAPVIGYSFKGVWDEGSRVENLTSWLQGYLDDVDAVMHSDSLPATIEKEQKEWRREWEALKGRDGSFYGAKSGKSVEALLETEWDQTAGYNNYCPLYSGGSYSCHGRALTGCVATAMAQIIRYHRYPNTGFGQRSYFHSVYGSLSAQFDSAYYNYDLMPAYVNYYSPSQEQAAVSLLCYHCGVAVKMNYENVNHTSGSGAHSNDVPAALKYFGYFNAYYYGKNAHNDIWDSLLKDNLNQLLPVYYSGESSAGGHAFVCDGYRNSGYYHFNFGWSGSGNGWYTLSSVNGYSTRQDAVFDIKPSGIGPFRGHYHVTPDGTGDGTSWANATGKWSEVMSALDIYGGGEVWLKNGVYYGDTAAEVAFTIARGTTLLGGFDGTEESPDGRMFSDGSTVLSGMGQRRILDVPSNIGGCSLNGISFTDGYAASGAAVTLEGGVKVERCIFANNRCDSPDGAALSTSSSMVLTSKLYNNRCGAVILNGVPMKNSLVAHNDGFGVAANGGTVEGCDIVCNKGVGLLCSGNSKIRNTVLWHNDSSMAIAGTLTMTFCAAEGLGERDSNSNFGLTHENRPAEGLGPYFIMPDTTVGVSEELGDWHLSSLSPLVDAGDTLRGAIYSYDLDYSGRQRGGRTDIGCLEWIPGNAIEATDADSRMHVFPNPCGGMFTLDVAEGGLVSIYDMMGRLVKTLQCQGRTEIDISHLPDGIYLLRMGMTTKTLIKR